MNTKRTKLIPMLLLTAVAFAPFGAFAASNDSAVGRWITIDDKTHKPRTVVQISQEADGTLSGKIVELIDKTIPATCDKCKGDLKGAPMKGLRVLWGLHPDGKDKWSDGNAMDPENGKTYGGTATLVDGGKKLHLRGYIKGFSFLGRTQTWERQE